MDLRQHTSVTSIVAVLATLGTRLVGTGRDIVAQDVLSLARGKRPHATLTSELPRTDHRAGLLGRRLPNL